MGDQKDLQGASDARDKNLDPLDLAYNGSLIEDEALGGIEYIAFDDLERLELPSEFEKYYLWEQVDPSDIARQHNILRSKKFKLPVDWYGKEEEKLTALIQNAYILATLLPELFIVSANYSDDAQSENVKRSLRYINSLVDSRVSSGSGEEVPLFKYLREANETKILPVKKEEMMEIRDVIWGRFIQED